MASSAELLKRYEGLIKKLWPYGPAWAQTMEGETGASLISALAVEPCRVAERVDDLLRELDPLTATDEELLGDWETLLGLPDECTPEGQTLQERQQQARSKLADVGGQSNAFFEQVAEDLGFPGTVVEDIRPFEVGRSVVGDALTNDFEVPFTVGMTVGESLNNIGWRFYFLVIAPATANDPFEVGIDTVGEPLVVFGNELLQCTIRKLKPAHTAPFFQFT